MTPVERPIAILIGLEVKDTTIRMRHEMTNDEAGDLAAGTEIVGVLIDMTTRKARSLLSDVRQYWLTMGLPV